MAETKQRALIFSLLETEQPNPKQIAFFESDKRHISYGGARGGGKSWAMRRKFILLAMRYAKLNILLLRRTLPELRENHQLAMQAELAGYAKFNADEKAFTFPNGSRIKLGYCESEADWLQYQGQAYEVMGFEECTNFTWEQVRNILTSNRSTRKDFKPRAYYTCNPGGVGHSWFKSLFIDKRAVEGDNADKYKPDDYEFIPAQVYDNKALMEANPEYVDMLESLPEDMRRAHLYGDWDVYAGQYFSEFRREIHVIKPFVLPDYWRRYVSIDYGLDMLAAYWIAVDGQEKAYVYKEIQESDLTISQAAAIIREMTGDDDIYAYLAPPDLFNRRQETGRSAIDIFAENGLYFGKTSNNRVQGWYDLKEWLTPYKDEQGIETAKLVIFDTCSGIISDIPVLIHDPKNPNDVSNEPHRHTHGPDAIRGFVAGRPLAAKARKAGKRAQWEPDMWEDYYAGSEMEKARMIKEWGDPF